MSSNKRKDYIDVAKGIAMILTVVGHTVNQQGVMNFIYTFHMPIFFVISGMLWKKGISKRM